MTMRSFAPRGAYGVAVGTLMLNFAMVSAREAKATPVVVQAVPVDDDEATPLVAVEVRMRAMGGTVKGLPNQIAVGPAEAFWAPEARLSVRVPDTAVALDAVWGGTTGVFEAGTRSVPLNPYLGAHYRLLLRNLAVRAGFGVAVPVASVSEAERVPAAQGVPPGSVNALIDRRITSAALGARGAWDAWLVMPATTSLIVPARVDGRLGGFHIALDGALVLNLPSGDGIQQLRPEVTGPTLVGILERQAGFGGQLGLEIIRTMATARFGLRTRVAAIPEFTSSLVSFEPLLQWCPSGWLFEAAFNMNLNESGWLVTGGEFARFGGTIRAGVEL